MLVGAVVEEELDGGFSLTFTSYIVIVRPGVSR
jgi:hypothetical protein